MTSLQLPDVTLEVNRFYTFSADASHGPVWRGKSLGETIYARVDSLEEGNDSRIYANVTPFIGNAGAGYSCTGQTYSLLIDGPPEHLDFMEDYVVYPYAVSK